MTEVVVSLRGNAPIAHPGKPDVDVIKELTVLLEKATAGEIIGIAYSAEYYDQASSNNCVGHISRRMIGELFAVMSWASRQIDEAP